MRGLRRSLELGFGTHAVERGSMASWHGLVGCGRLLAAAAALGSLVPGVLGVACGRPAPAVTGGTAGSEAPAAEPLTGNPFAGNRVYRTPYSNAENAQQRLQKTSPSDALLIGKIAAQPQASWFGGWSGDIQTVVSSYVNAAERAGELGLLVAYNVPNRDCGQYSAGGASDSLSYAEWIKGVAAGIGQRRAVVVLEPDALGLLTQCLSPEDQEKRLQLLHRAVTVLEAQPGVAVYIDAGHSGWVPAAEMAQRLQRAGLAEARGFALNTSNYQTDAALLAYGKELIQALGVDTHFIIDSSRNGNGPAPAGDPEDWCNPEGRALGRAPTVDTGESALDAFLWLKRPGESDGACKGGPAAGQWFEARALEMARNAKW